jgi:hypothetical protein
MAQITTYFTSSSSAFAIDGLGGLDQVAYFIAPHTISSNSNMAWSPDNRSLSLNGPETRGSTLVIAGNSATDATSAIDVRTSLTYGDFTVFKVYDNGRIDSQVLSGTGSGARGNVAIGVDAGSGITTGTQNVFLGLNAGEALQNGSYNTLIGADCAYTITSSDRNTVVGAGAMPLGTGAQNTVVGAFGLEAVTSGAQNTAIGHRSISSLTTGSNTVAIGESAGRIRDPSGSVNATDSIYIGSLSRSGSSTTDVSNEVVIGKGAIGAGDNTTTIGNSSCVSCFISGNVVPELGMTIPDGTNITFDDGTGTIIGTNAAEKFAFWGKTPNVQPTTSITSVTAVHGTGTSVKEDTKYNGYDLGQIVAALQRVGILA